MGTPRHRRRQGGRQDRGQAGVFLLIALSVLFVSATVALAITGGRAIDRTRAQTAADAAALASVVEGRRAADRVANALGAVVVSWRRDGDDVTVVVRLGDARASARATDAP